MKFTELPNTFNAEDCVNTLFSSDEIAVANAMLAIEREKQQEVEMLIYQDEVEHIYECLTIKNNK